MSNIQMPMSETENISQQEKSCVKGDQHRYKKAKIDPLLQKSRLKYCLLQITCIWFEIIYIMFIKKTW